jgi:hypothetical protein
VKKGKMMTEPDKIDVHPAVGFMAVKPIDEDLGGKFTEKVTQHEIDNTRKQIEESGQVVELRNMQDLANMFTRQVQPATVNLTDGEIKEVLEQRKCDFEGAVLVEACPIPGYPFDPEPGDTVYYHDGRGHNIGIVKIIAVEAMICWSRDGTS